MFFCIRRREYYDRGENLIFVGDNHILTKVEASQNEKEIIERGDKNKEDNNSVRG